MNTLMQPLIDSSKEHDHAFKLFEKLKGFYAQPLDGCWPLKPCWVPNLEKPPTHIKSRQPSNIPVTKFRRFTFDEFVQILEIKKQKDIETLNGRILINTELSKNFYKMP